MKFYHILLGKEKLEMKIYRSTLQLVMIMDTKWTHEDNKKSRNLVYQVIRDVKSDLEGIRTPNPQSRNLIFYPVELRSLFFNRIEQRRKNKDLNLFSFIFVLPSYFKLIISLRFPK